MLNVVEVVLRVLLCPSCAACGASLQHPLRSPVCDACWLGVTAVPPPRCSRCGDHLPGWRGQDHICARCRRHPAAFSIARSAGQHEGSLRQIVHAFKYQHRRALAGSLARLMRAAGEDLLADADAVVPVPLHPWRRLQRGFNQADDLARHLNRPVIRALRRRRHGPPQASLPAARRHVNLRQAYGMSLWCLIPGVAKRLRGTTVVLVDDVMTTGATLDACARVLRTAGVSEVRALTVARAAAPRQPPPLTRPGPSTLPR